MPLLPAPEPFDFELTTERFRAFGPDLAVLWHEGGLHRVVGGREVRIEAAPGGVGVEPLDGEIEAEVSKLLGFEFDLRAFGRWAKRTDPLVGRLAVSLRGFRPPLARNPFEMLVGSITAQQVSLRAALAIRNRFVQRFGVRGVHAYAFPARGRIARAKPEQLVALGLSRRKAEYVVGLARSDLDLDGLASLPDDEVKSQIISVRGLGEWTADWFLARHLGRPHAWPAGDLGVRKAVSALYGGGRGGRHHESVPVWAAKAERAKDAGSPRTESSTWATEDTGPRRLAAGQTDKRTRGGDHLMTTEEVRAMGSQFAPFQNLTVHYLLTGLRVGAAA